MEITTDTPLIEKQRALAEALHKATCTWNHTDGCGWYYEVADSYPVPTWEGWAHAEYFKKAVALEERLAPDVPIEVIILVIEKMKG